jgi:hypothetical protein
VTQPPASPLGAVFVPGEKRIKMEESSRYSENLARKCQSLPPTLFWIRAVMMHFEGWEFTGVKMPDFALGSS